MKSSVATKFGKVRHRLFVRNAALAPRPMSTAYPHACFAVTRDAAATVNFGPAHACSRSTSHAETYDSLNAGTR